MKELNIRSKKQPKDKASLYGSVILAKEEAGGLAEVQIQSKQLSDSLF